MTDYKIEVDLAENVLRAYEYCMRDTVKKGHCRSIEWKYQAATPAKNNQQALYPTYQPEVYDMVKITMGNLFYKNREAFSTLSSKYCKLSPLYKRQNQNTAKRNQRRRYSSKDWNQAIEQSLWLFWQEMKQQPLFEKYFRFPN
ncbi:hypothetical protein [Snodgrassella alvi]|jgi:hypothetical protein|uniref:hypothetical protein n=1 Tax=Snodgrassella alvi TaxID=1196083 RepID=UPI000C1E8CC8|nr:hypothetical protein [Snodgrassella alvi]PIT43300.1 hypothetical protein BHC51_11635 [Snodgrassella alvi]